MAVRSITSRTALSPQERLKRVATPSGPQGLRPPEQVVTLGIVWGLTCGGQEQLGCVAGSACGSEEVCPDRPGIVVLGPDGIERFKRSLGTVNLAQGDGAVHWTTGVGSIASSESYRLRICTQSVSLALFASQWTA